jgi:hypothetical protein
MRSNRLRPRDHVGLILSAEDETGDRPPCNTAPEWTVSGRRRLYDLETRSALEIARHDGARLESSITLPNTAPSRNTGR